MMDLQVKEQFISFYNKYFNGAELPLIIGYTDNEGGTGKVTSSRDEHCMISHFRKARNGEVLYFGKGSIACGGGNRYCGFSQKLRPGFEYFLSYGNETLEGERYKKDPSTVEEWLKNIPPFEAPGKYLFVKRWDLMTEADQPFAVLFFAAPDQLAALFTLANYDETSMHGVISPMGAGCMTIVQYPYFENQKEKPAAIMGMFDISARPSVGSNEISFAIPMKKFISMISFMDESFLVTESWQKLLKLADRP